MPSDIDLSRLHAVFQVAMGWTNSHLHQFVVGPNYFGVPHTEFDNDTEDEKRVQLTQIAPNVGDRFVYEYDFGDGWHHNVLVEKVVEPERGQRYPNCLGGKRACPPEDCGGPWGYTEFVEAIQDPSHKKHDNMLEWLGGSFDPEALSISGINSAL